MKYNILLIPILGLLIVLGLLSESIWDRYRNKFQVGDCVEVVYETEFYRTVYYNRIDKVGKKAYLVSIKKAGYSDFFQTNSFEWKFTLHDYEKTTKSNCSGKVTDRTIRSKQ